MIENSHIQNALSALERRGLSEDYRKFLLTPDYIKSIIIATNNRKFKQVERALDKSEEVLRLVQSDLGQEDIDWFSTLIHELRSTVASAKNELPVASDHFGSSEIAK